MQHWPAAVFAADRLIESLAVTNCYLHTAHNLCMNQQHAAPCRSIMKGCIVMVPDATAAAELCKQLLLMLQTIMQVTSLLLLPLLLHAASNTDPMGTSCYISALTDTAAVETAAAATVSACSYSCCHQDAAATCQ